MLLLYQSLHERSLRTTHCAGNQTHSTGMGVPPLPTSMYHSATLNKYLLCIVEESESVGPLYSMDSG